MKIFTFLLLLACCFEMCSSVKPLAVLQTDTSNIYTYNKSSSDGTGKFYMGREIAKVEPASRELAPAKYNRDSTDNPNLVISKMQLLPDYVVADIGAGTGYYTFKIADKLPLGKVYAVEVQDELISFLNNNKNNYKNIEVIKGSDQSPNLPDSSIDMVVIVKTYHELLYPHEMLHAIKKSLKLNGKLLLVEIKTEGTKTHGSTLHWMKARQIKKELTANGFILTYKGEFLSREHFMIFKK